MSAELGRSRC